MNYLSFEVMYFYYATVFYKNKLRLKNANLKAYRALSDFLSK